MHVLRFLFSICSLGFFSVGCAHQNSSLSTREAAHHAMVDPTTWVPLALASVVGLSGVDDEISRWASTKAPVFGSKDQARTASDQLQNGLVAAMLATSVLAPTSGGMLDVGRRTGANALAFGGANGAVQGLKYSSGRRRPDQTDRMSFPSGHAVAGYTSAHLIEHNFDDVTMPPALKKATRALLMGLATATAWARVEGEKHYLSDVLVSAALGSFFTRLSFGRMIRPTEPDQVPISVDIIDDEIMLRLRLALP